MTHLGDRVSSTEKKKKKKRNLLLMFPSTVNKTDFEAVLESSWTLAVITASVKEAVRGDLLHQSAT
jgi:hypothetical protein